MGEHRMGEHRMGEHKVRPYGTLPDTVGRVVQAFKSITTHEYARGVKQFGWPRFEGKLWQRNYYEHIIRNDGELNSIRKYITENPAQWALDRENRRSKE
jgi:REP element-mobilizing transposase RayT